MEFKKITSFQGINKSVHPRMLPDEQLSDGLNTIFKDGKVKSRWGYDNLGQQLSGSVLSLAEFNKLRTPDSDLIGITENSTYQYNESTGVWEEFVGEYHAGQANQPTPSEVTFQNTTSTYIASCKLTDTKFAVVCYNGTNGIIKIGTVATDGTISYGSSYTFNSGGTSHISICCLGLDSVTSPTLAYIVIAWRYTSGTSGLGGVIAGTVTLSTSTVAFGTALNFNTSSTTVDTAIVSSGLDSLTSPTVGYFTVAWGTNTTGSARSSIVTLSSNTIAAYGSIYNYCANATSCTDICILDSTHIVVTFKDATDARGKARMGLLTPSTKVIDFASYSIYTCLSNNLDHLDVIQLDNTNIAIVIHYSNIVTAIIGTVVISTGVISFGSIYTVGNASGSTYFVGILALDSTHIVVMYSDSDSSNYNMIKIGSVAGQVITIGSAYSFSGSVSSYKSLFTINPSSFIVFFDDSGDSYYGHSMYFNRLGFLGVGTTWSTGWALGYDIKFGTNSLTGTGTPDIWFKMNIPATTTYLTLSNTDSTDPLSLLNYLGNTLKLLSAATNYIIRFSFLSTANDFFDSCNIIKELGLDDEKQIIFTNGVDPIKRFDGATLDTLPMNGDSGTPPISLAKFCAYYNGILILAYCYDTVWMPQTIYWSRRGYPTHWNSSLGMGAGYIDLIQGDDYITKMEVLNQRLYVLKQRSIVECYATGMVDPALEFAEDKVKGIGCPYGRTCVNTGTMLIFKSDANIIAFNGFQPNPIGNDVIEHIKANENPLYQNKAFAIHLKKEFLYCLFIVQNGSTSPNLIYVLNYMSGSWTIWQFAHNMSAAGQYLDDKVVFGDINGNVYLMDFTELTDNGIVIPVNFTTKDFFDSEYALKLLQTFITAESHLGSLQISCSVDYGNTWSFPVVINQNTANPIFEHVQNWLQKGEQVRYKISNVAGSQFAIENFTMKYKQSGKSLGR